MKKKTKIHIAGAAGIPALLVVSAILAWTGPTYAADPIVSNVRAAQRPGARLVDIYYDLADADGGALAVSVSVSTNSGVSYDLPAAGFTGDVGAGVSTGADKHIVWDAGADWPGGYGAGMRIKVSADDGGHALPPEPEDVATAPEGGVVTLLGQSSAFLYTGENPIQTGVATGAIDEVRVAVLRGRVLDIAGSALSGVEVAVEGRDEYGKTLTRTNGWYDLAVNGGGALHLNFSKSGYLRAQHTLEVPWQDFVNVDDAVMIGADTNVTVLALGGSNSRRAGADMLVAAGGVVSDADGTRQARVFLPADVEASVITYEGQTQQVETLTTRFTEYTVGSNGLAAMPGDLPDTVAYTYCVELGADETQAKLEGKDVLLSTTSYFYVENFIGMPAGAQVPSAYYNKDQGAWVPSEDGLVIELKGTNSAGLAMVDADGDGGADSDAALAALGFTDAERRRLAAEYSPTQTLWRVPIQHFSTYDCNYGLTLPPGFAIPPSPHPYYHAPISAENAMPGQGSVEVESQDFTETCRVAGTPYTLNYSSERAPGHPAQVKFTIPVSTNTIPGALKRIELRIEVAGRVFTNTFAPATNLSYTFTWDGRDAYGRQVQGARPISVFLRYFCDAYYAMPPRMAASFGLASGVSSLIPARRETFSAASAEATVYACAAPALSDGLGGWTLDCHHNYDPLQRKVYMGDGSTRTFEGAAATMAISTVAGNGSSGFSGDGGPATNAGTRPFGLAVGPDGSLYIAGDNRVRKVDTNGVIRTVAGNGNYGFSGDGGSATSAELNYPLDVAIAPDGSIYIADTDNHRVRRVNRAGIISTVAGTGTAGFSGDGGSAASARLNRPAGVAVAPDGTLYVSDTDNHRVRRVGPDGRIHTVAGNGNYGFSGDGGAATSATLNSPCGLAISPENGVYIADEWNYCVRRVGSDGIIHTVAGIGGSAGFSGDGGPATNAQFLWFFNIALDKHGNLYIAARGNNRLRRVSAGGTIATIAGGSGSGYNGDGGPAAAAWISDPWGVAAGPDNKVYLADEYNYRVRQISPYLPGLSSANTLIASEDSRLIYAFTQDGRHLSTYDALTCEPVLTFAYNTNGFLTGVTDADGNTTTIQRDASGKPTAIASPFGPTTRLGLDAGGYLASVAGPAGNTNRYTYAVNGLMTAVVGARGPAYSFGTTYDADGRVTRVTDPAGGSKTFARSSLADGWQVAVTTALGRASTFAVQATSLGDRIRSTMAPDGSVFRSSERPDGTTTQVLADGTTLITVTGPDPRFGMQAPVPESSIVSLPSGLACTALVSRAVSLNSSSPLDLAAITNTIVFNGRTNTAVYIASSRTLTDTSAAGRQAQTTLDAAGRIVSHSPNGLPAMGYGYDSRGRLTNVSENAVFSSRSAGFSYDANGFLCGMRDNIGRTTLFHNDPAGLSTQVVYPDSRVMNFEYDAHGNAVSVTPPGRPAHAFTYNMTDLTATYTPPSTGGTPASISFAYNADRQVTQITRPDVSTVDFAYDAAGRLDTMTMPGGVHAWTWHSNGLASSVSAPSGVTLTNAFDGLFLTSTRWQGSVTGAVNYSYNNDLRLASMQVEGAAATALGYDADGLLTNAGACALARDPVSGLVTGSALGNASDIYAFDGFAQLAAYSSEFAGTNLLSYSLQYDALGRVTNKTEVLLDATNTFAYAYDSADRLCEVRTNGFVAETYLYDQNGNRTNWASAGSQNYAVYDAQDKLLSATGLTNIFDANGVITGKTVNGQAYEYEYDAAGNLLEAALPGPVNIAYLVDGNGRRVGKTTDGSFTQGFLYGPYIGPIAELGPQTNLVSVFVYASRANVPDYMIKGGVTYRIVCDPIGSPRLVVNAASGDVAQELDYDAFGRVTRDTAPGFQPFGFAGGLYDPETGLVRFGVRDYDPETGRWTSPDPILFAGGQLNLYAYVNNDPANRLDMTGTGPGNALNEDMQRASMLSDILGIAINVAARFNLKPVPNGILGGIGVFFAGWQANQAFKNPDSQWYDKMKAVAVVLNAVIGTIGGPIGAVGAVGNTIMDYGSQHVFGQYFENVYTKETRLDVAFPENMQRRIEYLNEGRHIYDEGDERWRSY